MKRLGLILAAGAMAFLLAPFSTLRNRARV